MMDDGHDHIVQMYMKGGVLETAKLYNIFTELLYEQGNWSSETESTFLTL